MLVGNPEAPSIGTKCSIRHSGHRIIRVCMSTKPWGKNYFERNFVTLLSFTEIVDLNSNEDKGLPLSMVICRKYADMAVFLAHYIYLNKLNISATGQP